jgi:hypothetical protein
MARSKKSTPVRDRLVDYAEKVVALADEAKFLSCPKCGCKAVSLEIRPGVGVKLFCQGYDPLNDTNLGECDFFHVERVVTEEELPAMIPVPIPLERKDNAAS